MVGSWLRWEVKRSMWRRGIEGSQEGASEVVNSEGAGQMLADFDP
jgi:hypothetical protein